MSKKSGATFQHTDKQSEAFHFGLEQVCAVDAAPADDEQAAAVTDDHGHASSEVPTRLRYRTSTSERGNGRLNVVGSPHLTGREFATGNVLR